MTDDVTQKMRQAFDGDDLARKNVMLAVGCQEIERLHRQLGELRAAFRVNMLRHASIENVDAEIDRVLTLYT